MTPAQEQRLIEVFNNKKVLKAAKKFFDRSFSIMVLEDAGTKKLHIRFVHEDNGQKWMTAADVAALTSVDTRTVRRWCETRAQRQSEHPIPFFRMNGLLRFERAKIEAWMRQQSDAPVVLPTSAAKKRKPKS